MPIVGLKFSYIESMHASSYVCLYVGTLEPNHWKSNSRNQIMNKHLLPNTSIICLPKPWHCKMGIDAARLIASCVLSIRFLKVLQRNCSENVRWILHFNHKQHMQVLFLCCWIFLNLWICGLCHMNMIEAKPWTWKPAT